MTEYHSLSRAPDKPDYDRLRKTMKRLYAYYHLFLPLLDRAVWLERRVAELEALIPANRGGSRMDTWSDVG